MIKIQWLCSIPFRIITTSHNAIKPEVLSIEAQQIQISALKSWNISLSSGKVNINLSAPGQSSNSPPRVTAWTPPYEQETPEGLRFYSNNLHPHITRLNFFFLPHHEACEILIPWPGIEPGPSALDLQSLNPEPPGKSPRLNF